MAEKQEKHDKPEKQEKPEEQEKKRKISLRTIITLAIIVAVVLVVLLTPLRQYLSIDSLKAFVENARESPWAPLIYIGLYIIAVIFAVPGFALTIVAGPIFGLWWGTLYVVIASNIGTQITFFISRYAGRDFIARIIKHESFLDKVSKKFEKNDFLVMLYIRLIPLFPFNVINYLCGLTPVRYKSYTIATFVGMLPGTFVYVYLSTSAVNIRENPLGIIVPIILVVLLTVGAIIIKKKKKIV
jgi:uncharacterized membrane protein YdjX (TVP38/TMEM64 family)